MRIVAVLCLAVSLSALFAGPVAARAGCSCATRTPQQHVGAATAVFSGTVTDVRVDEPMLDGGSVTVTLRADHVYKGGVAAEFEVVTKAQGPACGYEFVKDSRYLVFASTRATTSCSGNLPLPAGDQPLRPSGKAQGMEPLTPELIAALGTPIRVNPAPPSAPDRIGLPAIAVVLGVVVLIGVMWTRRRARAHRNR